jgi:hypothetical protein
MEIIMKRRRKIYYVFQGRRSVPFIRISGKYLSDYGLNIGDSIELTLSKGEITIHKINQTERSNTDELK